MPDVTQLLSAAQAGDPQAAADLLPVVYDELRRLVARHLVDEPAGHTLDATALVHEAYLRLAGRTDLADQASLAHFFSAAGAAPDARLDESAGR